MVLDFAHYLRNGQLIQEKWEKAAVLMRRTSMKLSAVRLARMQFSKPSGLDFYLIYLPFMLSELEGADFFCLGRLAALP